MWKRVVPDAARWPGIVLTAGLLAFVLSGCAQKWEKCKDAACRLRTAETAFRANPKRTLLDLRKIQDPVELAALVEILVHAEPGQTEMICAIPDAGSPASERCQRMSLRPHLFDQPELATMQGGKARKGSGPAWNIPLPLEGAAPWAGGELDSAALLVGCGKSASCIQEAAEAEANGGNLIKAGLLCELAWPKGSSAFNECLFQAAEHAMLNSGVGQLENALKACGQAGALGGNCTQHVLLLAIPAAPPANRPDAPRIAQVTQLVEQLRKLGGRRAGPEYAGVVWSRWTLDAFEKASSITGHLLGALPAEAAPHVRAAAAWRWLNEHPNSGMNLDKIVGMVSGYLRRTGEIARTPSASRDAGISPTRPTAFWYRDRNDDDAVFDAVFCLDAGRRATVADPELDMKLAVLEAAARMTPHADLSFFLGLLGTDQPYEVRWTAARLAMVLSQAESVGYIDVDPDPRVRGSFVSDLEATSVGADPSR